MKIMIKLSLNAYSRSVTTMGADLGDGSFPAPPFLHLPPLPSSPLSPLGPFPGRWTFFWSSMLVPLESSSAVLVMISSKSVSICNRFHA